MYPLSMTKHLLSLSLVLTLAACAPATTDQTAQGDQHSEDEHGSEISVSSMNRLTDSPRHQEWVEVKNGEKSIYAWVVYPQVSEKASVVLVIHENRGLNDWARSLADQVAEAGYIAVAPDLLSGYSEEYERTSDFPDEDAARGAISELDQAQVTADLEAVAQWAKTIEASNGKIASAGFCWGGSQSFQLAAESDDLSAALVFYGTGPEDQEAYENVSVPVFGFYGGADERVNATIDQSNQYMTEAGKEYDYKIYDGAGHAFMRLGEDPNGEKANIDARNAAWVRMGEILEEL